MPAACFECTSVLSVVRLSGVEAFVSFSGALYGVLFDLYPEFQPYITMFYIMLRNFKKYNL